MLLLDDGRVGFIDFGMVGRVGSKSWQAVFNLFTGLGEENYALVAQSMLDVGMTRDDISVDKLTNDIAHVFEAMEAVDPQDLVYGESGEAGKGINEVLNSLGEVARNHGIRFPRSFTLLLKQFLYFDRYVQVLDPGANLFDDNRIVMTG